MLSTMIETCEKYSKETHLHTYVNQRSITFGESLDKGLRIAEFLRKNHPNQKFVPLISDIQIECSPISLGTWLCGKTSAPVASTFADRDLAELIRLSEGEVLFVNQKFIERVRPFLKDIKRHIVVFNPDGPTMAAEEKILRLEDVLKDYPATRKFDSVTPDNLVYLIFSSGSTGRPKGIRQTYKNLLHINKVYKSEAERMKSRDFIPGYWRNARQMGWLSFGQTFFGSMLFCSFLSGASFCSAADLMPLDMLKAIEKVKPEAFLGGSPGMIKLREAKTQFDGDLSSVKVWICTGAPFSYEKIRDFEANMPGRILQGYGMTETTSACAVDDLSIERPPGSCGRILAGVEVAIRDENGQVLKSGEIGEITCRSDFNVAGYLDNPEADKEAFRNGWLWTGDMGYEKDGFLYFMDRKKRMICVNTSKVYPTRVEEAVFGLGHFREVACIGVPSTTTVEAPVVFFVKKDPKSSFTTVQIQGMLKNILRTYEIPVDFVEMDALPRQNAIKLNYLEMSEIYKKKKT